MDNNYNKALEFARSNNYETIEYLGQYKNYYAYNPILKEDDLTFTGLPYVILVNDNEVRLSDYNETMELINYDFK